MLLLGWYNRSLPELKGTTEEKGEYGRASSTVGGLDRRRRVPMTAWVPIIPFATAFWMSEPFGSMVCAGEGEECRRLEVGD